MPTLVESHPRLTRPMDYMRVKEREERRWREFQLSPAHSMNHFCSFQSLLVVVRHHSCATSSAIMISAHEVGNSVAVKDARRVVRLLFGVWMSVCILNVLFCVLVLGLALSSDIRKITKDNFSSEVYEDEAERVFV